MLFRIERSGPPLLPLAMDALSPSRTVNQTTIKPCKSGAGPVPDPPPAVNGQQSTNSNLSFYSGLKNGEVTVSSARPRASGLAAMQIEIPKPTNLNLTGCPTGPARADSVGKARTGAGRLSLLSGPCECTSLTSDCAESTQPGTFKFVLCVYHGPSSCLAYIQVAQFSTV